MPLRRFINYASSTAASRGFDNLKRDCLPVNELLLNTNRLKNDPVRAIGNRRNGLTVSHEDTKTYLAVSSLIHCFDGWNYLSSSINNFVNGEKYISIHLGYYAELRASMSFLATEGIGIFDHLHISANGSNLIQPSPDLKRGRQNLNGTHAFIWEALDTWIKHKQNTNNILRYFTLHGKTFENWLQFIPNASNPNVTSQIIKLWLKEWSFDINNYQNDRSGRNTFSYRPTRITDLSPDDLDAKLKEISEFWNLLEPDTSNRFALLDKYLFKIFLQKIHLISRRNGFNVSLEQLLDRAFVNAGLPMDAQLKRIVLNTSAHSLLTHAQDRVIDRSGHSKPLSVISRAILMLRFCSGATAYMLKNSGITKSELNFYWNLIGEDFGFWTNSAAPVNFIELWDFVKDSIENIEDWRANSTGDVNLKSLNDQIFPNYYAYTQFNRAALWGTGL